MNDPDSNNRKPKRVFRGFRFVVRCLLAILFLGTGAVKLFTISTFIQSVSDFGVVWDPLVTPVAYGVCFLEVIGGIGLLIHSRICQSMLLALTVLFIFVLSYGIRLGLDIDCGCYGPGIRVPLTIQLIIDIMILAGLLLIGFKKPEKQK